MKKGSQEFAADIGYETPGFSIDLNGSADLSTYIFAPDKYSLGLQTTANIRNLTARFGISKEITDYSGEK